MSEPPPFVRGVTRYWAVSPLDESQSKLFPVSRELYFDVRSILNEWAEKLLEVREWEKRFRKIQVNVEGQTILEVLSVLLPRLQAIYAAMNTGKKAPHRKESGLSFSTHGNQQPRIVR